MIRKYLIGVDIVFHSRRYGIRDETYHAFSRSWG